MDILVVEPSVSYRAIVKELMNHNDILIKEAVSGEDALAYLQKNKPSAISLAHELGDMDSFTLLEKLKGLDHLSGVPKFLITSNMTNDFKRAAYDAGFTEIFQKSDMANLKRAMKSLLLYTTVRISANILYIEDTQSTADYTRYIMENAGWTVSHVKSGEEAAELLEKQEFDLVVTDLILEGKISGIGLIHLIRQGREEIRNMPILAVSGWNDLLRQVYVLKHGAGDFIAKPFHETDFLARAINLILNKRQLDESIASQRALYQKANLDSVSGLNNRHYIDEYGEQLVQYSKKRNEAISLCVMDIDYFKEVNDQHGHALGDEVLRQIGQLVRDRLHPRDVAVRYGGDEIILLMPDCNKQQAQQKMETLRSRVESLHPQGVAITATIGVASLERVTGSHLMDLIESDFIETDEDMVVSFASLFEAADQSLYLAKNAGRNCICVNRKLA